MNESEAPSEENLWQKDSHLTLLSSSCFLDVTREQLPFYDSKEKRFLNFDDSMRESKSNSLPAVFEVRHQRGNLIS